MRMQSDQVSDASYMAGTSQAELILKGWPASLQRAPAMLLCGHGGAAAMNSTVSSVDAMQQQRVSGMLLRGRGRRGRRRARASW